MNPFALIIDRFLINHILGYIPRKQHINLFCLNQMIHRAILPLYTSQCIFIMELLRDQIKQRFLKLKHCHLVQHIVINDENTCHTQDEYDSQYKDVLETFTEIKRLDVTARNDYFVELQTQIYYSFFRTNIYLLSMDQS